MELAQTNLRHHMYNALKLFFTLSSHKGSLDNQPEIQIEEKEKTCCK